ncbi:MAG: TetR/AcrR family transcriptional regulator [Eubacterium sp.]|nr:TetR/AcrR family transcriptional regulator [Eubacterium sp.]
MSYSSQQTRQRILDCAKLEFLEQGFQKANLRKIATDAKATTGALYNHFKNKAVLFDALVKEPADTLLETFCEMHKQAEEEASPSNKKQMTETSEKDTDWVLDYIYDNFDAFRLIFCCSQGTAYSDYLDRLSEIEENSYRRMIHALHPSGEPVSDFFIHVICSSGLRQLREVVAHNLSKPEAEAFMEQIKRFRFAGWQEILGQ